MMLLLFVTSGLLAGAGVVLAFSGLFPRPVPLSVLANETPRSSGPTNTPRSVIEALAGNAGTQHAQDMAVAEMPLSKFVSDRIVNAITFAFLPGVAFLLSVAGVIGLSPIVLLVVAAAGAVGGWVYTTPALKRTAAKARTDFEVSLATYFELVSLAFAGGKGPMDALREPAAVGTGPAFRQLRAAMNSAAERREAPWVTLIHLGNRLGVQSLTDLGASVTLASDGAPVVDSLRAKAESMRDQAMSTQEARAEARSETLSGPIILMFAGFIILLGYPALAGLVSLR
jgi:tight adherence protein C